MNKKFVKILISAVITLLLLRAMAGVYSRGHIVAAFKEMNLNYFAAAAVCYVLTYPVRSFRIYYMMKENVSFAKVVPVCMKHQFFSRIIPFKAGELSLVFLLKQRFGSSVAKGGTVLVLLRIFDASVMVLSFIICNFFVNTGGWLSYLAAAFLGVGLFLVITAYFVFPKITRFLRSRGKDRAADTMEDVAGLIRGISPKQLLVLVLSTVVLWAFIYLSMYFVAIAFFEGLTVTKTVAASFLASVAAFLPVNGIGGFGTTEAGWTLGFSLVGVPKDTALISGVVSNLMSFIVIVCGGIITLLLRGEKNVQNNHNKQ